MKSYPLRTSITFENELETCCNPDSVIKPVSQSRRVKGGWGKQPTAFFSVVCSPERDPEVPRAPPVLDLCLALA